MARRVTRLYHYVHWEDPERGRRGIHPQPSRRMAVSALSLRAVGCNVLEIQMATGKCRSSVLGDCSNVNYRCRYRAKSDGIVHEGMAFTPSNENSRFGYFRENVKNNTL